MTYIPVYKKTEYCEIGSAPFFIGHSSLYLPTRFMNRYFIFILSFIFTFIITAGQWSPVRASPADDKPGKYIQNGGYAVLNKSELVFAYNENESYVPASIVKIVTSLAGMRILGKDYHFATNFYLNDAKDLYIRGYGDPYLVSEEIDAIAEKFVALGLSEIRNIYLDESAFNLENITAEGTSKTLNPYDVTNGALTVNFNTINIQVADDGSISSAEPQTPTLPLMRKLGKNLPTGVHRINITTDNANSLQYVGELFRALFKARSISVHGIITDSRIPENLQPFYVHASSYDLARIVEGLMLYSNNFIANQIFLTCGAHAYGYPATWKKARQAMDDFLLKELGLDKQAISLEEGSGISRKNKVTPRVMAGILNEFMPYADLLAIDEGVRLKSGTLSNVFSYAGYFQGKESLVPFVLILNQPKNTRDRVLKSLKRRFEEMEKNL